jgi:hypothetical protein
MTKRLIKERRGRCAQVNYVMLARNGDDRLSEREEETTRSFRPAVAIVDQDDLASVRCIANAPSISSFGATTSIRAMPPPGKRAAAWSLPASRWVATGLRLSAAV